MISITHLKSRIATYPDFPPRTTALEQRIQIGTGFHGKWYRSQKEHMLGWMIVQEAQAREKDRDPSTTDAKQMWGRLKCSPSMFWLAEAAGVEDELLDEAENAAVAAAAINSRDGEPHGRLMREVLPWDVISRAIAAGRVPPTLHRDDQDARAAFEKLARKNHAYRRYLEWI